MAMNRIQFQAGLSLPAFMAQFSTEIQCEEALEHSRWPQGFQCPGCGHAEHYVLNRVVEKPSNASLADYKPQ